MGGRLDGKIAIVTGGGQGIGRGIALALASEGAAVIGETPLGRLGDPEADIGRAVAALVSDDLKYLTGATLLLDGSRTIIS